MADIRDLVQNSVEETKKKRGNKGEIDALAVSSMSWFSPFFFDASKKKKQRGGEIFT